MEDIDFHRLPKEERILAKVLLKNNLISKEVMGKYLEFLDHHNYMGKEFLGEILLKLEFITQNDIDEFVESQQEPYMEFCESLARDGFIMSEQLEKIRAKRAEGKNVVAIIDDLNIMTKDNFVKIFNNKVGGLRLGEWLVIDGRVTDEQIAKAREVQKVNSFQSFLTYKGYLTEAVLSQVVDKIASRL